MRSTGENKAITEQRASDAAATDTATLAAAAGPVSLITSTAPAIASSNLRTMRTPIAPISMATALARGKSDALNIINDPSSLFAIAQKGTQVFEVAIREVGTMGLPQGFAANVQATLPPEGANRALAIAFDGAVTQIRLGAQGHAAARGATLQLAP